MKIQDIVAHLHTKAPRDMAEPWDNVGFLVGADSTDVNSVLVTLDITPEALAAAKSHDVTLIISHHPVLFAPVKHLYATDMCYQLAAAGIAAVAVHTNADRASGGVNDALAAQLGLQQVTLAPDGLCRLGVLPTALLPDAFAALIAEKLGTPVRIGGTRRVQTVGLCSGSGGEYALSLQGVADGFVTGEMKHHEWLAALQAGMTIVEAGHYATETCAITALANWLRELPQLSVYTYKGESPYRIVGEGMV